MSALDQLDRKARQAAERTLETDEDVITIVRGRSKQALIVTDRQVLIVKPGVMAGAAFGAKAASFSFESITKINVHSGLGVAALEVVTAFYPAAGKPDLRAAFQRPNWLPCDRSVGLTPLIDEVRAYVQSGGRARSARAALSGS
jgi:hypothetical protein